jgi:hypothetical protein
MTTAATSSPLPAPASRVGVVVTRLDTARSVKLGLSPARTPRSRLASGSAVVDEIDLVGVLVVHLLELPGTRSADAPVTSGQCPKSDRRGPPRPRPARRRPRPRRGIAGCRASRSLTCTECQFSFPVGVRTPRSFNASAMSLTDVTPAAQSPAIMGATSAARASARALRTFIEAARAFAETRFLRGCG